VSAKNDVVREKAENVQARESGWKNRREKLTR